MFTSLMMLAVEFEYRNRYADDEINVWRPR